MSQISGGNVADVPVLGTSATFSPVFDPDVPLSGTSAAFSPVSDPDVPLSGTSAALCGLHLKWYARFRRTPDAKISGNGGLYTEMVFSAGFRVQTLKVSAISRLSRRVCTLNRTSGWYSLFKPPSEQHRTDCTVRE